MRGRGPAPVEGRGIRSFRPQGPATTSRTALRWALPLAAASALGVFAAAPARTQATTIAIELPDLTAVTAGGAACSRSSAIEANACSATAIAAYLNAVAGRLNLADRAAIGACTAEAAANRADAEAGCTAQATARVGVCRLVGEAPYDARLDPRDFVDPRAIGRTVEPNRFFPLVSGTAWTYDATFTDVDGEAVEKRNVVTVTDALKLIDGVLAIVVRDVVLRDGEVHEDTDDWYAQDRAGNVWYLGEEVKNYAIFEGDIPERPELVDIHGTWKAGVAGGRAGIIMPAEPVVGQTYRQEFAVGGPQDIGQIVALGVTETVPGAACVSTCLVTRDFTPAEPGLEAHKYYAPGIGLILEVAHGGERVELVAFTRP